MTSIRQIQTERVLQDVVHTLYSQGSNPLLAEVLGRVSRYLSHYRPGQPLPIDLSRIAKGEVSDVEGFNEILEHTLLNLDVLYETSLRQVDDIMMLNDALYDNLERLKAKQRRLEQRISDYLLMNSNSEGHFLVVTDNFSDLYMTDLTLTSARVDTQSQYASIPSLSASSYALDADAFGAPTVSVMVDNKQSGFNELAPFSGALEPSARNILWAIDVEADSPKEVVVTATLPLAEPAELTQIDFTPYGNKPTQVWFEIQDEDGQFVPFGRRIQTSIRKISMTSAPVTASAIRFNLRKTEQDYIEDRSGSARYKYVFGSRSIVVMHQAYERNATFISNPILVPNDMKEHTAIDALSLDTVEETPAGTNIEYYVAAEDFPEEAMPDWSLREYSWRRIEPIKSKSRENKLVRFDGALLRTRMIRSDPTAQEIQLLPKMPTGPVSDRNPSPTIIEGVDVFRIAELQESPIRNTVELIEGVNTTRITSKNIDPDTLFDAVDLSYWARMLRDEQNALTVDYGRIDAGNEFFYGGDIGASGKDVMVEAFIECETQFEPFLAELQKVDPRSRTWDVKAFLNGRPLGEMGVGVDKARVPWSLRQGLNHVVLVIRIPLEAAESHPYMGAISLMGGDRSLQSFGLVRLDRWSYVDLFTMRYNETGNPKTFTIHNNEIISRRNPTDNFQLRYAVETGLSPQAVRLRADFTRSRNTPNVAPRLESYSLRFGHGSA